MTRTLFAVRTLTTSIRKARRHARMPEWAPDGWSVHPTDPAVIVAAFPPLRVRPEYRLVAYQYHAMGNGNAVVYAVPNDMSAPEPEECPRDESQWLTPPVPPHALPDVRLALEDNGTPKAYMAASLAYRELCEMGAAWHGIGWSDHVLLGADPRHDATARQSLTRELSGAFFDDPIWQYPEPQEWSPHVDVSDNDVTVRFVTVCATGSARILMHVDRYAADSLVFESEVFEVAIGPGGRIY